MDSPSAFFRRFVRRPASPAGQDPADLGTAFGLEASLGPVSRYDARDARPAGEPAEAADAPMNWLARRQRRPG